MQSWVGIAGAENTNVTHANAVVLKYSLYVSRLISGQSASIKLDDVVFWLYQHMIREKLQHAEDYFWGYDPVGCRSKELLSSILLAQSDHQCWLATNSCVISIL